MLEGLGVMRSPLRSCGLVRLVAAYLQLRVGQQELEGEVAVGADERKCGVEQNEKELDTCVPVHGLPPHHRIAGG
eukprot:3149393-Pyramimonas_sp.AAC.1